MKWIPRLLEASLLCAASCFVPVVFGADTALDTGRIEQLTGLKGALNQQEGVFKVNFPRKDFQANVAGTRLIPDQGLSAWAAFTRAGDHTMVMGDIVLLENEVNPVMSAALANGLEVTALHNHFLWDSPKVMFMHIGGMGDEAELARAVGRVFGKLKEVISTKPGMPAANIDPAKSSFDPEEIEQIVGAAGVFKNGVYKIVIGRTAKMGDHEVGKEMGINTWAAFTRAGDHTMVMGDIVLLENEVNPVMSAALDNGL